MARQSCRLLLFTALLSCVILSQAHAAASPQSAPPGSATGVSGRSCQSAVPLNGPWKFHTGDDPQWADASFDDSSWQDYTIDPEHPDPTAAQTMESHELPGWQRHGHPGYTGYAWYRIRIRVPSGVRAFALMMPQNVDDAYEVYINGEKVGGFGKLSGWRIVYPKQTRIFLIPPGAQSNAGPATLAIRMWSQRDEALPSEHNLDGGLRGVPLLGPRRLLAILQQSAREQTSKTLWPGWLLTAVFGGVGIISLFLYFFSRSQREYLWAGISLTGIGVLVAFESIAPATSIPMQFSEIGLPVADCVGYFALPLAAMYLLGVARPFWRRANYVLLACIVAHNLQLMCLRFGLLPPTAAADRFETVSFLVAILGEALLLLGIAVDGLRTTGRRALLPLTPGLLCACGLIADVVDPVSVSAVALYYYFYVIAPLAVLIIFLMRFGEQQRENGRLVEDMRQAREVQQVMLPDVQAHFPGYFIESEYRPAREVGGDFFQVIPCQSDGSLLVVAGDVTGKGLKAGMVVALLVGAIRTAARFNPDPLAILDELNQRLLGRRDVQATCLALRIDANGHATLANAGHLPPYLNGEPLPMSGAIPLGMIEAAEFSLMHFQLESGDKLVLMSDGIAEATNARGEIYGFERAQQLLRTAASAAGIAGEAQRFGQQDDISVIAVTRVGVVDPVSV
jgi:hypothetical protein